MTKNNSVFSVIIPAKNEAENLEKLLPELRGEYPKAEVIVVDDGSTDHTSDVCRHYEVAVVRHYYSKGNGASIKAGARAATNDTLVFMDGDGQHRSGDIARLLQKMDQGADMVVGARSRSSQANFGRLVANSVYNKFASLISGHPIPDLTSGFRAVKRSHFLHFLYLLPNGFSYPTTCTMAYFRAGFSISYISIETGVREGKSHISLTKDGLKFLVIIFKVGTLYSPLKVFLPISLFFFVTGLVYYLYTYLNANSFTNMGVLLFVTSVIVFLIGLVSEQITALIYKDTQ